MKITVKNQQKRIFIHPRRIQKTILSILSKEGAKLKGQICVSFVTDAEIKKLNFKFLKINLPTDVLAFQLGNKYQMLADIIISSDTAIRNAKFFKTSSEYEINLYVIHGVLHLLGYNDLKPQQKQLMHKKELVYAHS